MKNSLLAILVLGWFCIAPVNADESDKPKHDPAEFAIYVETCQEQDVSVVQLDQTLCFEGSITPENAKLASEILSFGNVDYMVIDSAGGDVTASLELGLKIHESEATLIVKDKCFSSCANYLVIAAKRLVIWDGAIVGMHGSPVRTFGEYVVQQLRFRGYDLTQGFDYSDAGVQEVFAGYQDYVSRFLVPETIYFGDIQANENYIHRYWESLRNVKLHASNECKPEGGFIVVVDPGYFKEFRTLHSVEYFWWPESKEEVVQAVIDFVGETTVLIGLDLMPTYVPSSGYVSQNKCLAK